MIGYTPHNQLVWWFIAWVGFAVLTGVCWWFAAGWRESWHPNTYSYDGKGQLVVRQRRRWYRIGYWLTLIPFVLFLGSCGKWANQEPAPTPRQIVQERVNACLKAGGTPIVTDAGTRSLTHPYYWGCKK